MIDADALVEIIQTYHKHGWMLRRILLTLLLRVRLPADADEIFGEVEVIESEIDAAWFSRPPRPGGVAWELRHLSETPFALLEKIDETDAGFEHALRSVETRLIEAVKAKNVRS